MSFTIREPAAEDAEALADLHVSTWKETYAHLLPGDFFSKEHLEGRRRMWDHVLANPRDEWIVRVAESNDLLIGFAWIGASVEMGEQVPPRERELYAIYVTATHYGAGVGQALLDETLGAEAGMLWVAKENPRATAFYARNGFEFDGAEQIDPATPMITDARMIR